LVNDVEEKILSIIGGNRQQLVSLTQRLIRERSVNPPGDETGVAAVLEGELSSCGMTVKEYVAAPRRVNLISVLKGSENRHSFLFNGHMDTVPQGDRSKWTEDPFEGVVRSGRIFGRGAADM
jgi:succinyl-diaminopimelate desuccinylase